jgi:hypothetical protein
MAIVKIARRGDLDVVQIVRGKLAANCEQASGNDFAKLSAVK